MQAYIRKAPKKWGRKEFLYGLFLIVIFASTLFFLLPSIVTWKQTKPVQSPFPVGVDPKNKRINENKAAALLFAAPQTPLEAAAGEASGFIHSVAMAIAATGLYQLAASAGDVPQVVTIDPGFRKEQVAHVFAKTLGWNTDTQKMFLQLPPVSNETLTEGTVAPDTYAVSTHATALEVQTLVAERFQDTILSRYTPAIQKVVPLAEGLTIASILERETSDPDEMRIISGIIWNRIFSGMKLQMDSTLQYAKATGKGTWWPIVFPKDKYIDSPYNTYQNGGLPPGPIADPSIAAVLAALNPKNTSCLYYFHDNKGGFHCSDTYEQHVSMLKKYFGQGR